MNAIQIKGLGKCFKVPPRGWIGLTKKFKFLLDSSCGEKIWAVKGLSLSIKKGECLGIIGKNGSGKTTLLKLISGILKPTEGEIEINGTTSLIHDLGSSFDFELTGKENLFLYGSIAGLSDKETGEKIKEVTEFSGLGNFMDLKVKTYSSGMIMRLAFAAVTLTNPDILLIDEVLSVGDLAFQNKSMNKIKEYKQSGKTMVIVSHQPHSLIPLCDKCMTLHNGRKIYCGNPAEAYKRYVKILYNEYRHKKDINLLAEFLRTALESRNYIKDKIKIANLAKDLRIMSMRGASLLNGVEANINTVSIFVHAFWYLERIGQLNSIKEYESYEKVVRILLNTSLAKDYNEELLSIVWKKFRLYSLEKRVEKVGMLRETFMQCLSFAKSSKEKVSILTHHKNMLIKELNLTKPLFRRIAKYRTLKRVYEKELSSLKHLN